MSYFVLFCSCVVSSFSIAITSLGEEGASLGDFRTFARFVLVWFCLLPLHLGVWNGPRFVIVALPGLFSYLSPLFLQYCLISRGSLGVSTHCFCCPHL